MGLAAVVSMLFQYFWPMKHEPSPGSDMQRGCRVGKKLHNPKTNLNYKIDERDVSGVRNCKRFVLTLNQGYFLWQNLRG